MLDKKYQIFISSTYKDLIEPRETIIKAILNLYHIPIGMEMFSADNDEQWETIKTTIKFSDYYVLIIGHRYGTLSKEGISYTEKEFDYAKEIGVPVLAFIRHRDLPTTPSQREADPGMQLRLIEFIGKASTDAMVDFWNDEKDLATKVIVALTKIFTKKPMLGWVRSNQAMSPEVADELASLSKDNRKLREELKEIQSKIVKREPKFEVLFNSSEKISQLFITDDNLIKKSNFSISKIYSVPNDLKEYIYDETITRYNKAVEIKELEVKEYNTKVAQFERVKNSTIYDIEVKNLGTAKANNVVIELIFPDSVRIMKQSDVPDSFSESATTFLPSNPIDDAREVKRAQQRSFNSFYTGSHFGGTPTLDFHENYDIKNNILRIRFKSILHTQSDSISKKIAISFLKEVDSSIDVKIICEEFEHPQSFKIPITLK